MMKATVCVLAVACLLAGNVLADDWPQFQQNAMRQGRVTKAPAAPYRARWIWFGPDKTLRNKDSNPAWADDLEGRDGHSLDMPARVPMTFADGMQPVHAGGVLYALDQEGKAYAINMADGSTKWIGENPGGSMGSPCIVGDKLICASVTGRITALNLADGKEAWALATGRAISGSPAAVDKTVYVANHGGYVYSINASDGTVNWKVRLSAPCVGGICADEKGPYVGAEDMFFHALDAADGGVRARKQLIGQSYRMLWPVLYKDKLFVQVCPAVCSGSEGVMDDVLRSGQNADQEHNNIQSWLKGDTHGGQWRYGGENFRHLFVLETKDLYEPYIVSNGPIEGCGTPPDPPVVDNEGRLLVWWRTKFHTFVGKSGFGTDFSCEISGLDLATGKRVPIDNGKACDLYPNETDNLYGLSVGGDTVFLRQRFRGTHGLDLKKSEHHFIQASSRNRDGGTWRAYVTYVASGSARISTPSSAAATRTGPVVADDLILFAESFCITAMEADK